MSLLDLTPEQQKAFNRLKKAYADCKKLNIELINEYGTLVGYDGNLINDLGDDEINPKGHAIYYQDVMDKFICSSNKINFIDSGRADDPVNWMFGLTDKGLEIFNDTDY